MKDLNDLHMDASPNSAMIAVGWDADNGDRFHVWLANKGGVPERPFAVRSDSPLYRNPALSVKYRGEGYFRTRELDPTAKTNAAMVNEALRRAETEGMFEAALAAHAQAESDKTARRERAQIDGAREALRGLIDKAEDQNVAHNAEYLIKCDDAILLPIFRALRFASIAD